MIVKQVTYSKTYESLVFGQSVWQKIGLEAQVEEGENPYEVIEKAREIVEESHKKYLPEPTYSIPIPPKKSTKLLPDAEIRKQYAIAAANRDDATVEKLEAMYSFKIG